MNIKNINRTIFNNGDTSDIIKVVMMAYDIEDDPQIKVIAEKLKGNTDYDTCRNIWQYLITNINYRADSGKQEIKSPARLINDKVGDCKSYSLFTAVILRYLGIPHIFRFVSYDKRKEATHVYVLATTDYKLPTTDYIIIDAVAHVQAGMNFNTELKYTFHCDMKDKGTIIAYLAGLPAYSKSRLSSIGNIDESRFAVWIGDDEEQSITPAKHFLYSRFDLQLELLNIAQTAQEQATGYNQLDITAALLYAYNYVNGDTDQFKLISFIVCGMISEGDFQNSETDENIRANRFDLLLDKLASQYESGYFPENYDRATWQMINDEVLPHNELVTAGVTGIKGIDVIGDQIKKGGFYFLYKYIPDNELSNYPAIVAKKRAAQLQVNSWLDIDLFHTRATRENLIRSGIIAATRMTPETFITTCKTTKITGIGDPITLGAILVIISTIVSIILGLITLIRAIWPPKNSPTNADIANGAPDPNKDLFDPAKNYGTGTNPGATASLSTLALPIAIGGSILYFLFKKQHA